jgi:septum formation protein
MLVLASSSPRRRELLAQAGFSFEVHPSHISEEHRPGETPEAYVTRLARKKALAVFNELTAAPNTFPEAHQDGAPLLVLGADTIVNLDGQILGKPADAADAARMLHRLSGRSHQVITGIALITASSDQTAAETTTVRVSPLTDEEIATYIATGEPMDKAGAYAIQGRAARWIPRIYGCYSNVVGLPLARVSRMLASRGLCASLASPPQR